MRLNQLTLSLLSGAAFLLVGIQGARAGVIPGSELLNEYLVIATGSGTSVGNKLEAFSMSNTELGADQEVLSQSGSGHPQRLGSLPAGSVPNLQGVFAGTAGANASFGVNRWNDTDHAGGNGLTTGEVDNLPGARPLFEGIDYSGNVAVTGNNTTFFTSNSDVNANIGVKCSAASCALLSSTNSYFSGPADVTEDDLAAGNGVSSFTGTEVADLVTDLTAARDFIVGLTQETLFAVSSFTTANGLPFTTGEHTGGGSTFASAFVNRNIKDANTVVVTDLDAIDVNDDGFAVIDINAGSAEFSVNNTDWILKSTKDTLAIFRLIGDTTQYKFANSSIMLGGGLNNVTNNNNANNNIDRLGAIFFTDAYKETNEVIDLSNVVLGGVGLWDFTDFNPRGVAKTTGALADRYPATRLYDAPGPGVGSVHTPRPGSLTRLNLQNAQGCAQFIGHEIDMSNNRWQRCDQVASVPEPSSWLLFGFGLAGLELIRRAHRMAQGGAA